MSQYTLHHGDCLDVLRTLPDNSIDALVTDPPAGIEFMGKEWDHHKGGRDLWIAWLTEILTECRRVLKPGAHALIWALPRTSHWTALAIEDAGFEVRDSLFHHFSTGFPKSLAVDKALDKMAGAERKVVSEWHMPGRGKRSPEQKYGLTNDSGVVTAPATDLARKYEGWGTALKPSTEMWWLARKPLIGTVAQNVTQFGTGALNVGTCRVGAMRGVPASHSKTPNKIYGVLPPSGRNPDELNPNVGRWPSNLLLSHTPECNGTCSADCAVAELDRQSGVSVSKRTAGRNGKNAQGVTGIMAPRLIDQERGHSDSGGASRFFPTFKYAPKASRRDRNSGLPPGVTSTHPTVKSTDLMEWLCRLITPPDGIILDPFCGSGSTGVAALRSGFSFVGIEREEEYIRICEKRLEAATARPAQLALGAD